MDRPTTSSRDLLRALLVGLGAFVAVGLVETTQIAVSITQAGKPTSWWSVGSYNLIYWSLAGLLTPLVAWLAGLLPLTGERRWRHGAVHVVLAAAFGMLHISLYIGIRVLVGELPAEKLGAAIFKTATGNMDREALIYGVILAVATARDYYRGLRIQERRQAELRASLSEARLESLKMQLQPHFLFNAMHGVSTLIKRGDGSQAHDALLRLSDFLRLTLEDTDHHEVPLQRECEILEAYLHVQQVRYGDDLTLECRLDPECRTALVPHLVLQPLAENSLRHGLGADGGPGRLVLEARRDGDRLRVVLADNGRGLPDQIAEGRGLANVRARLAHLHPDDHRCDLRNGEGGGAVVILDLPWRTP